MEEKKGIRKDLIVKRDAINSDIWNRNSYIIQRNIIQSEIYKQSNCILCYADFHGEVGTLTLIEDALLKGKHVFLPKVLENFTESRMEFYEVFSTLELINGYKGIMEPTGNRARTFNYDEYKKDDILMLIPGVAFSKDGSRLGYGKGYYDYYLKDKPEIFKVGICFSMQITDSLPTDSNDVLMDLVVTEETKSNEIKRTK